jgi:hypothetical protein
MVAIGWSVDCLLPDAEDANWTSHLVAKAAFAGAILAGVKLTARKVGAFRKYQLEQWINETKRTLICVHGP